MRLNISRIVCVLAVVVSAGPMAAGVNRWTSRGPNGGQVSAIVSDPVNPSTIYLGSTSGIFRSDDEGSTWRAIDAGGADRVITSLAVRKKRPEALFAGTASGRVLRSEDGGDHWSEVSRPASEVLSLAYDDVHETLYAIPPIGRVMASYDGGLTWDQNLFPVSFVKVVAANGKIYCFSTSKIYVTEDGGKQWSVLFSGEPLLGFAVSDEQPDTLVIGTDGKVLRSTDGGAHWQDLPIAPLGEQGYVREVSPYAGGIIAATSNGVYRYDDSNESWSAIGEDLKGHEVSRVFRISTGQRNILAFREDDAGLYGWSHERSDFSRLPLELNSAPTNDIALAGTHLYAGTGYGLTRIDEEAALWTSIAVSSSETLPVRHVGAPASGVLIAATGSGTHRSVDGGETWNRVAPDREALVSLGISPSDPATMYAAMEDGMAKSMDGGETWDSVQNNMPFGYYSLFYGFQASAVVVDPVNPNTVYVCSDDMYKSVDGGASWTALVYEWVTTLAISGDGRVLYAAPYSHGVLKSEDGGATWTATKFASFVAELYVSSLAVDPSRSDVVYAAISGHVMKSVDGGEQWKSLSAGLPGVPIRRIILDETGNHLYAATAAGVFEFATAESVLGGIPSHRISLRTASSNFVTAEDCGGSRALANAVTDGPCEILTLYDLNGGDLADGDRIYLRAQSEDFLSAENGGASACSGCESPVNANRTVPAAWETFTINKIGGTGSLIVDGDNITLRSIAGDYIAAEGGGRAWCRCDSLLNANRAEAREWETFGIVIHP